MSCVCANRFYENIEDQKTAVSEYLEVTNVFIVDAYIVNPNTIAYIDSNLFISIGSEGENSPELMY
jgi:hypothetical protein